MEIGERREEKKCTLLLDDVIICIVTEGVWLSSLGPGIAVCEHAFTGSQREHSNQPVVLSLIPILSCSEYHLFPE